MNRPYGLLFSHVNKRTAEDVCPYDMHKNSAKQKQKTQGTVLCVIYNITYAALYTLFRILFLQM